ncbi:AraC family transcriptional regulator [Streptomonospora sediminis]
MADDQLSEVFSLVEVQSVLTGGLAARGAWVSGSPITHPLKFFALLSGRGRLRTDGPNVPLELETGDVGILNNRGWVELRGGPDGVPPREVGVQPDMPPSWPLPPERDVDDVLVGGRIDLNPAGEALLLHALPPVSHVRAAQRGASGLRSIVDRLFDELAGDRVGSPFAIRQYGQLLLLETLRAYLEQFEAPPGWLQLLADERLRPAVALMHGEPGRSWGLEELARAAAMSRASFAGRFRKVSGMTPLAYLSRWRMMLAQRALSDGEAHIGPLAVRLGYGSESAFSTAFKREMGMSPSQYRRQVSGLAEAPAPSEAVAAL